MNSYQTPPGKDPHLWQIAQRRASFKSHLAIYLVVNIFLWLLWYFTSEGSERSGLPWPVWPMLGWGIGVVSHYVSAYVSRGQTNVEKEYQKLTDNNSNQSSI